MNQTKRPTTTLLGYVALLTAVGACGGESGTIAESGGAPTAGSSALAGAPGAGAPAVAGASAMGGSSAVAGAGGLDSESAGNASAGSEQGGASPSTGGASAGSTSAAGAAGRAAGASGSAGASAGSAGAVGAGGAVNQSALPAVTLHLAGDSTVMDYGAASAQEGWGQELGQYFINKVAIDNRALGGASIQTFQSRWTGIVSALQAGDFVMADFGINDSGGVAGRSVSTADFRSYLLQMNTQARAKQATLVIVTPSALQYWSGGKETNARLAPYVAVETMLGVSNQIPIDDLNGRSLEFLNMIGQTAAAEIYINGDKAHFTKKGATQMASLVAGELRRIGSPLAAYLK